MSLNENYSRYSQAFPSLTEKDWDATSRFLNEADSDKVMQWADEHTELFTTSDKKDARDFKMVVEEGEDASKLVLVTGEFANERKPYAIARALATRALAAPEATLVIQPNNVSTQWNMHYSHEDRTNIKQGNLKPLIERIGRTFEQIGHPEELSMFGPSQGGVVSLAYAAGERPDAAVAVLETPNVIDRTTLQMTQDFMGCGANLKEELAANFEDPESLVAKEVIKTASMLGLAKYAFKMATLDNLWMINVLARGDAEEQMKAVLNGGGSVVHAWATGDKVSPAESNLKIWSELALNPRYEAYELEGDHSITNAAALDGALLRRAIALKQ